MTDLQRRCVIDATIEPLTRYPRGFARTKAGPFYFERTVKALVRKGALRKTHCGRLGQVTARAA